MQIPNFFIIGAPKSGTTSMYRYLETHPRLMMSTPKEPAYWSLDYPRLKEKHAIRLRTADDYFALFAGAQPEHLAVGEASTVYLSSTEAVPRILEFNPTAKLLIMLRNPVEFAPSFHSQKLFDLSEEVDDFEQAWRLQAARAEGRQIPRRCLEPKVLQYRMMGSFGTQVERVLQHARREQVKVVLFDDLVASPAVIYREVLEFLGLEDDGRSEFPQLNTAKQHRARWTQAFLFSRPGRFARRLGKGHPVLKSLKTRLTHKPRVAPPLRPEFRAQLVEEFADEIRLIGRVLERDLSHWLAPPVSQPSPR